jgi:hypothetical protein
MKRSIPFVLGLLFVASINGLAQQSNAAEAVFEKWRQAAPADEVSRLGFALACVTRRTGDDVAELDLWASRRAPEVVVEVQPLYVEKLPNGEYRQEQVGAPNKTTIGGADGQSAAGDKVGLKLVLPVSPNANSLVIKWVSYGGGKILNSTTVHVWLKDEASESLTRITASR